jgi:hypothetical protein
MDQATVAPATDRTADRTRTGAVWITALGAFMLFAAAGVFVAVRWDELADGLKLAVLGGLTGTCLLAGSRLRPSLPATGGVLFHLGAFLVPVNAAAVAVHLAVDWPAMLLVEGATATATWAVLGRRSRVLAWAAVAAAVVTAAGISATVASAGGPVLPTALILAAAAVAAELVATTTKHRYAEGAALVWATVAGAAPVATFAERVSVGSNVAELLGLTGSGPGLASAASGVLSAAVLGRMAARREDPALVVLAAAALAMGIAATWTELAPGPAASLVGAATLFLAVEVAAARAADHRFWRGPLQGVAVTAEVGAGIAGAGALPLAVAQFATQPSRIAGAPIVAGIVAAAAWAVADVRRRRPSRTIGTRGWGPATAGAAGAVVAGALAGTAHADVVVLTAIGLAALVVVTGRSGGHAVAGVLVAAAPLAHPVTPLAIATGVTGALVLAAAAVLRACWAAPPPPHRLPDDNWVWRRRDGNAAWVLALTSLLALVETAAVLAFRHRTDVAHATVIAGLVVAATVVSAVLERAPAPRPGARLRLSSTGRILGVLALLAGSLLPPPYIAVLATLVTGLALVDALYLDRPGPLWALPVSLPGLALASARTAELAWADTGIALAVLAAVCAGIHVLADVPLADERARAGWGSALLATTATSGLGALALTAPSPADLATVVIVLGTIGVMLGAAHRQSPLTAAGLVVATAGVWLHLDAANVTALDAYAAPVAVALVIAGVWAERGDRTVSSWVTYAPAVALAGGSALAERIAGGHGIHALAAGAVGVAAVMAGGSRRLIGPLATGTALIVALTAHESLGVSRQVPTWAWLAAGGAALVATGLWLERRETGPLEAGRRVVDVVTERFT